MARLMFGITYDYLCPFARNANEHVVAALQAGADWEVRLLPFSLSQAKAAESGEIRWDAAAALRRSGVLALAVAELVRAERPDLLLEVHRELFALRHDRGEDLRDPDLVASALQRAGAEPAIVDRAAEGLPALQAAHEELVAQDVWGVPTFIGAERAVFVRLLERAASDAQASIARIERVMELVDGDATLHEFKQVDLPR